MERPGFEVARLLVGVVTYRVTIEPFTEKTHYYVEGQYQTSPSDPTKTTVDEMDLMMESLKTLLIAESERRQKENERLRAEYEKRQGY